jgi:glyoxylase-like metal-dependent hydrolase (beta-lactamase superfamily II)
MPQMIELAPGVYRVPTMPFNSVNSFIFGEPDGSLTLVDAGLKRAPRRLLAAIAALGKQPSDVRRIVMTHAHIDHAGGLAGVQRETGARTLSHADDAGYLARGEAPPGDRRSFLARVMAMLPGGTFGPCLVDDEIADDQVLDVAGGLRVIHTPGHTPGHVSLLHEPSGVLIVGDALFNVIGMTFSIKFACADIPLSRDTAGRLGELDFEIAAFMHGAEIRERARERMREFLRARLG